MRHEKMTTVIEMVVDAAEQYCRTKTSWTLEELSEMADIIKDLSMY